MAVHRQQTATYRAGVAQHVEEQGTRLRDIAQRLGQVTSGVAQMAQRGGIDTSDVTVTYHHIEHPQNGLRFADKQRIVAQIDQRPAQLEVVIDGPWFFIFRQGENRLIEQLQ